MIVIRANGQIKNTWPWSAYYYLSKLLSIYSIWKGKKWKKGIHYTIFNFVLIFICLQINNELTLIFFHFSSKKCECTTSTKSRNVLIGHMAFLMHVTLTFLYFLHTTLPQIQAYNLNSTRPDQFFFYKNLFFSFQTDNVEVKTF